MTMIEFQNKIDHFIDRYCEQYHYSGVLRITHRDQVLYERSMGYADWEKKIPMDLNCHFTMYSLSKPFCAIGLLLLVDQGLVSLDAHPAVYVPEAAGFDSRVTIRNMLLHSSGMPDFGKYMRELDIPNTNWYGKARELVLADAKFPQEFVPGTNTQYANINFTLAALVIENVTGMDYADYMRERVFEPLGMLNTLVDRPGLNIADRAVGHDYSGDRILRKDCDVSWMLGAGDVLSTVDDVYQLNLAIKHQKLLKPDTWQQVLTPSPLSQFGFGCSVTQWHGKKRITHNGGHQGFRTLHIQLPEDDFDIILLSNCGFGDSRNTISEAIYAAFYGEDGSGTQTVEMDAGYIQAFEAASGYEHSPIRLTEEEASNWLGIYEGLTLTEESDSYRIRMNTGREMICDYFGNGLFANRFVDERYRVICSKGEVMLLGNRKIK